MARHPSTIISKAIALWKDHPIVANYFFQGESVLLYNGGVIKKDQIFLTYLCSYPDGRPLYAACRAMEETSLPPIVTITKRGPEVNVGPWNQLDWAAHVLQFAYTPMALRPRHQTITFVEWLEETNRLTTPRSWRVDLRLQAGHVNKGDSRMTGR